MTLNVNEPSDQALISELPGYIREDRAAINAVSGGGNVGTTDLEVAGATTSLTVGSDLGEYGLEVVKLTGLAGGIVLETILGGTEGQVKIFVFEDNNISFLDGAKANGEFYLNHLPALSNYDGSTDAVLALVNIGGDGGASTHGYWKELYRTVPVK
jgi:hypothetical protein